MKLINPRNVTFDEIQSRLHGWRSRVYEALKVHGPCTTRQLADRAGIDLLTVGPRIVELRELHLVEQVGQEISDGIHAGVFQAVAVSTAARKFETLGPVAHAEQMQLC